VTEPPDGPGARRRRPRWVILVEVLVAVLAVTLVQALVVKPFQVPSQSMENTLDIGDRILVNRTDHGVHRFDIVVFGHGPTWAEPHLPPATNPLTWAARMVGGLTGVGPSDTAYTVKRVIGLPGDHVSCCSADGRVVVDGRPIVEPYLFEDLPFTQGILDCTTSPRSTRCFPDITVPSQSLLVLGDHRSQSADSVVGCRGAVTSPECARFVPTDRVVGPVVARFWPLGRFSRVGG